MRGEIKERENNIEPAMNRITGGIKWAHCLLRLVKVCDRWEVARGVRIMTLRSPAKHHKHTFFAPRAAEQNGQDPDELMEMTLGGNVDELGQ